MARILVTGATGFVGGHLVDALLERGDDVVCLTRSSANLSWLNRQPVEQVHGDLNDTAAMKAAVAKVDTVYHVAGSIRALSEADFMETNAAGTRRLAEACALQPNPPVFVYVSSLAAAGPTTSDRPLRESDPCQPISRYGRSKREGELALARLASDLPVSVVRPPVIFGGRDNSTKTLFNSIGRTGIHFALGYRHRRRYSLVHVGDLVQAMIAVAREGKRLHRSDAVEAGFRQGCYFVAFDEQPTYAEFGQLIGEAYGRRFVAKIPIPDMMTTSIAAVSDVISQIRKRPNIFSNDKAREIKAGSWICSTDNIKADLGFEPADSLRASLKATVAQITAEVAPAHGHSDIREHAMNS